MKDYDETTYGHRIAEAYDELYVDYDPAMIELLAELAGAGPALELGIGTGRIALPLHAKGIAVQGIDVSEAMISKLRAKEHGAEIEILTGSFAEFKIDKRFKLIYVVFNTFFGLLTQAEQVRCFRSVSEHLTPDGAFVLEAFVPDLSRFVDNQTVRAVNLNEHIVQLDVSQVDPVAQQISSQHLHLSQAGVRLYPVKIRYAWPSELDLMAQVAGLALRHRWGSWSKGEFTKHSQKHISIYGLAN
ncbi:MAG TPA: class I SAM-dependent methyltransferase [Anaerolineales bacterium]|nr:class I SAM-dependent methyltransferase [Anaerolineales bacterium]